MPTSVALTGKSRTDFFAADLINMCLTIKDMPMIVFGTPSTPSLIVQKCCLILQNHTNYSCSFRPPYSGETWITQLNKKATDHDCTDVIGQIPRNIMIRRLMMRSGLTGMRMRLLHNRHKSSHDRGHTRCG